VPNCTPDILSPFQTITAHHASCTGLSILLVCALRAVGAPARVAGTARWNTSTGGNHDWVEIWDHETGWSFTGPAEFNPILNRTWFFPYPAKNQVSGFDECNGASIFATSWAPSPEKTFFPMVWLANGISGSCWPNGTYVNAIDVTENYLSASMEEENHPISSDVLQDNTQITYQNVL